MQDTMRWNEKLINFTNGSIVVIWTQDELFNELIERIPFDEVQEMGEKEFSAVECDEGCQE